MVSYHKSVTARWYDTRQTLEGKSHVSSESQVATVFPLYHCSPSWFSQFPFSWKGKTQKTQILPSYSTSARPQESVKWAREPSGIKGLLVNVRELWKRSWRSPWKHFSWNLLMVQLCKSKNYVIHIGTGCYFKNQSMTGGLWKVWLIILPLWAYKWSLCLYLTVFRSPRGDAVFFSLLMELTTSLCHSLKAGNTNPLPTESQVCSFSFCKNLRPPSPFCVFLSQLHP